MKEPQKTSVRLLSWTQWPIETVYCEWQISRTNGPVPSPQEVREKITGEKFGVSESGHHKINEMGPFEREVRKVFEDCVSMKVPIAETLDFVFELEHVSIALREQMVRHRVGHKFGGTLGADLIPDIADSSWWSQTMRVKNMGTFANDGEYLEPAWLEQNGHLPMPGFRKVMPQKALGPAVIQNEGEPSDEGGSIREWYREQMAWIQTSYNRLVKAGMPEEDARNLLPLGTCHRLTWKMNLSALMHVMSKRGCWIAQLGMWEPVILGMIEELATKVDPFFRRLVDPPCIGSDGNFDSCKFHKENEEHVRGNYPHFPCPLWLGHHQNRALEARWGAKDGNAVWDAGPGPLRLTFTPMRPNVTKSLPQERAAFIARAEKYAKLWGRDPVTGERRVLA